jgi:hypothetical protein
MIRLVCATRCKDTDFFAETILGRSLNFFRQYAAQFELRLFGENGRGLSSVYNQAIEETRSSPRVLVFIHDDIHFFDLFWPNSILAGLKHFDLIGTLGCKRHYPNQLSWVHVLKGDKVVNPKREDVSGAVVHFSDRDATPVEKMSKGTPVDRLAPFDSEIYLSYFGPPEQEVVLLDGMLMACKSERLIAEDIRFDEQFDFHFYDMDFCRQFEQKGLKMGTWPISVLHGSHGSYEQKFFDAYPKYRSKWVG